MHRSLTTSPILVLLLATACGDDASSSSASGTGGGATTVGSAATGSTASTASNGDGGAGSTSASATTSAESSASTGAGGTPPTCTDSGVEGTVTDEGGAPLEAARVTILSDGVLREVRTDAVGAFSAEVAPGAYAVGASRRGYAYVEDAVAVADGCTNVTLALGPETHPGLWTSLGDAGERLGGTNSGVMLPDGRVMYCHDTLDPVIVDPVTNERFSAPESPRLQGCHAVSLLPDGRLLYVGGADQPIYGPGTKQVKIFDPEAQTWTFAPELNDFRWYPTMAPLPGGGFITIGGGGADNPIRVKTSETIDLATLEWTPAGDVAIGNEVSPIITLFTGQVLMTHRPPQLYDPGSRTWSLAGDFVQADRMANGDHADHELVMLADGRVVAIGFLTFDADPGQMVEIYDPAEDTWDVRANVAPVRSRASILQTPDQRILVMGGKKQDLADPTPVNTWGQVSLTDVYDPATDAWRRLDDMTMAREYHAMPILLPDARVLISAGEGEPGNEPEQSILEVFEPPYLFRGPRPTITSLSATEVSRGDDIVVGFANTTTPTHVLLVGANATTHFMDSGPGRLLDLPFEQVGGELTVTVPSDEAYALPGWYLLFVMVDDIPSEGRIVRVE